MLEAHSIVRSVQPQGPHEHILMTGGSDRGSYFIPKKIPTSEFVYPKKSLLFLAYPKNPSVYFVYSVSIVVLMTHWKALNYVTYWIFLSGLDARGVQVITFHIDYNLRNIP